MVVHEDVLVSSSSLADGSFNPVLATDRSVEAANARPIEASLNGREQAVNSELPGGGDHPSPCDNDHCSEDSSCDKNSIQDTPRSSKNDNDNPDSPEKLAEPTPIPAGTLDMCSVKNCSEDLLKNDRDVAQEGLSSTKDVSRVSDANKSIDGEGSAPNKEDDQKPPCPNLPLWKTLGPRESGSQFFPIGGAPLTPKGKPSTPRGVTKQSLNCPPAVSTDSESSEKLNTNGDGSSSSAPTEQSCVVDASLSPPAATQTLTAPINDSAVGASPGQSTETSQQERRGSDFVERNLNHLNESVQRNYLLSVVIVTNATMSHIRTVFPKFLPTLTAFFQEKQIYLDDLVCSARDLWGDEFPFEHFYDFWKCWTLEDVLSQLRHDGVRTLTVLSIGDDEPERKAAAYVRQEMPELVRGLKLIKMVGHPDINEISIQLEYLIRNLREYIHRTTPFDVLYKLEESSADVQPKILEAIEVSNQQSAVIQGIKRQQEQQQPSEEISPDENKEEETSSGDTPVVITTASTTTESVLERLASCVIEIPHTTPPDPPNPFEAALIQFELKFEQFHKLFSRLRNGQSASVDTLSRDINALPSTSKEGQTSDSVPADRALVTIPPSIRNTQLAEAARNRSGLHECVTRHVANLIDTNRKELIFLGRDCVGFLNQIQRDLPTILAPKTVGEDLESEDSGVSTGTEMFDLDGLDGTVVTNDLSNSTDILLGLVHNVIRFLLLYPTMFLEFTRRDHQALTACVVHVIVDVLSQQHGLLPALTPLAASPLGINPSPHLNNENGSSAASAHPSSFATSEAPPTEGPTIPATILSSECQTLTPLTPELVESIVSSSNQQQFLTSEDSKNQSQISSVLSS